MAQRLNFYQCGVDLEGKPPNFKAMQAMNAQQTAALKKAFMDRVNTLARDALGGVDDPALYNALRVYALKHHGSARSMPSVEHMAGLAKRGLTVVQNATDGIESSYALPKAVTVTKENYKAHHEDIFKGEDRIYYELDDERPPSVFEQRIKTTLAEKGYTVTDYKKGYATDQAGKQQFKIGKLLREHPDLQDAFRDDATRKGSGLMVALSRHPYDIARMTTGRGWPSCMGEKGLNHHYVYQDMAIGTVVGYLVNEKDPNIHNPTSRILLKPYMAEDGSTIVMPGHTYGLPNYAFAHTMERISKEVFNAGKVGEFKRHPGAYADGEPAVVIITPEGHYTHASYGHRFIPARLRHGECSVTELFDYLGIPYTRTDEGKIVVHGALDLSNMGLTALPADMALVEGVKSFYCEKNQLTSLAGCPQTLMKLICSHNRLTSLEGCPQTLKCLICSDNQLTSLEGAPRWPEDFCCARNPLLVSAEGCPPRFEIGIERQIATNKELLAQAR